MSNRRAFSAMAALGALLACAGCVSWPPEGSGGLAEYQQIENLRAAEIGWRLDVLAAQGADSQAASDMVEARTLLIRVRRALAGGLAEDAERDMDRIDACIGVIETRMTKRPARNRPAKA